MRIVHIVAGLEGNNGMANTAREFAAEEVARGDEAAVTNDIAAITESVDEVMIHGAWLPLLWKASKRAKAVGARLVIRPAGSYDPVRLAYHSWKKWLVAPFEHGMLRRADVLLATCEAEVGWIRAYEPKVKQVEVTDLRRFFRLSSEFRVEGSRFKVEGSRFGENSDNSQLTTHNSQLHVLYLGRRHPLKGLEYLEEAVKSLELKVKGSRLKVEGSKFGGNSDNSQLTTHNSQLELRTVSNAFGEEKEKVWEWCDVLVLPTLSENFGRVIAEALERGKRVITTDGAPAWGDGNDYGGRLLYLKGFRDGTRKMRVQLLKNALEDMVSRLAATNEPRAD